jgi:hypothetical protein
MARPPLLQEVLALALLQATRLSTCTAAGTPGGGNTMVHAGKWKQHRYVISMWVDPQVPPEQIDAHFNEIADANFSVHLGFPGESLFGRSRG